MSELKCPECGEKTLVKFGKKFAVDKEAKERIKRQQYQCTSCGRITVKPNKEGE